MVWVEDREQRELLITLLIHARTIRQQRPRDAQNRPVAVAAGSSVSFFWRQIHPPVNCCMNAAAAAAACPPVPRLAPSLLLAAAAPACSQISVSVYYVYGTPGTLRSRHLRRGTRDRAKRDDSIVP
jgi:hypothetical protein